MDRTQLQQYLDQQLQVDQFKDYCPNGLQVEGRDEIQSILCATTANLALCQKAAEENYDAILCHHGFFWRNESPVVTGTHFRRLQTLLKHNINLFAYHLPLDVHPQWGNNLALAEHMGWQVEGSVAAGGVDNLLWYGRLPKLMTTKTLRTDLKNKLAREPQMVGDCEDGRRIQKIAWCTGAAEDFIAQAGTDLGAEAYISGEISLATPDTALELGMIYFGAGHHATERYGVQKLGNHLQEKFKIRVHYREQNNPV